MPGVSALALVKLFVNVAVSVVLFDVARLDIGY